MSEGEGGYKPSSIDTTKSRRAFLKDMLRVGAGVAAVAVGAEMLPGQQPPTAEAASPAKTESTPVENDKNKKLTMFEADSTEFKPVGAKFQILSNLDVSDKEKMAVQRLPFMQMGGTVVAVADELINKAQTGEALTQQQVDAINQIFVEAELKVFQILYPQNPVPKNPGKSA